MRQRHQDHRLPPVAVGVIRVRLAHHDQDSAARVERPRSPPFAAVDDVVIAVAADARLDVGGFRRRDVGLANRKGRTDLAGEQSLEPTPALLRRAIAHHLIALLSETVELPCYAKGIA